MLLPDAALHIWQAVISPWRPRQRSRDNGEAIFSRGQGPYSYDLTLGRTIKVPNSYKFKVLDPKHLEDDDWLTLDIGAQGYYDIPAHGTILASIEEYLTIPTTHLAVFLGKSSYARCSVHPHITPGEPGWHGHLVVEIGNLLHRPVRVYVGEGVVAMILLRGESPCNLAYQGKYQGQAPLTMTRL